jgi:TolB protein
MSGTRKRRGGTFAAASAVALVATLGTIAGAASKPPELISRAPGDGPAGNGASAFPWVSGDGRLVAFRSEATNLVADDTDTERDIFVRDRRSGQVVLASRASGANGVKGNRASFNPRMSPDGRYVVFRSNANNLVPEDTDQLEDIYVRDLQANETILVSRAPGAVGPKGNGGSFNPSISADGRRVAFRSEATNLSPEDTDAVPDIYVRDLTTN